MLIGNYIGPQAASLMNDILMSNPSIVNLDLCCVVLITSPRSKANQYFTQLIGNNIGTGVMEIANALVHVSYLVKLNLRGSKMVGQREKERRKVRM